MRLIKTTLLTATAASLMLAPSAPAAVTWGISDQQATTFIDPLYAPLKLKTARYVAPYDVMDDSFQLKRWDDWYKGAQIANQKILISFEHSRTAGKERKTPSVSQYEKATRKFAAAYPKIEAVNTWNEVNACQKPGHTERQPAGICKPSKAKLLVSFWKSNKKVFKKKTIIPVNVLDDRPTSAKSAIAYITAFKKAAGRTLPKVWGLHNYSDTNRSSQVRTKKVIKAIGKGGQVWLLETGGQLNLVEDGTDAARQTQAAEALGCMFYIGKKNKQIKRGYIYQFNPGPGPVVGAKDPFDAGLIGLDHKPRLGYEVVRTRTATKC